jgi:polyhydroxybutyrate depolymerase
MLFTTKAIVEQPCQRAWYNECLTGPIRRRETAVRGTPLSSFILIMGLLIGAGGCRTSSPESVPSGTTGPGNERAPAALHAPQSQLTPGDSERTVTVQGRKRSYFVHVGQGINLKVPQPVILAFNGGGGSPQSFAAKTDLNARSGNAGFIVVYPLGIQNTWNAGSWKGGACCGEAQQQGIDDVAFTSAILDDLASVMPLDVKRIFATGFSNGGALSYRLACELPSRIAAIAVSSASIWVSECHPSRPVPVLHFHGTADRFAPYEGGTGADTQAGSARSAQESVDIWVSLNGCTSETLVTYQHGSATCVTHPSCKQNAETTLCTIQGMGHQWPGGTPGPSALGATTHDISATDMLLSFFQKHPM